jgi:hypothetical protein
MRDGGDGGGDGKYARGQLRRRVGRKRRGGIQQPGIQHLWSLSDRAVLHPQLNILPHPSQPCEAVRVTTLHPEDVSTYHDG